MKTKISILTISLSLALSASGYTAYHSVSVHNHDLLNQLCNVCNLTLVQSGVVQFGLFGVTSGPGTTGQLICNVYQGSGAAGQPFYLYEYQLNANLLGPEPNHCIGFDLLDPAAEPLSWDLDGSGKLSQIFSITDTSGGGMPVYQTFQFGSDVEFDFGTFGNQCGLTPGSQTLVFGFVSQLSPIPVAAQVVDYYTDPVSNQTATYRANVQTFGPSFCGFHPPNPCLAANPFSTGMIMQALLTATNGGPAPSGTYTMQFQLFDSPTNGNPVSGILTQVENVVNGVFTANLDFGPNSFHPRNHATSI